MKTEEDRLLEELYQRDKRIVRNEDYLLDRITDIKKRSQPANYPDAKLHKIISFVKSGVRILGYVWLFFDVTFAALILILSEVIGIIEETV